MRIFVLGAGRMGSSVVRDLVTVRKDIELGVGDLSKDRAESLAKEANVGEAYAVEVTDLDNLALILGKYDAVVNATWFEYNLHVMKACVKAGCNYNDLGGLFHMTRKQLELNREARAAGISVVVGGGESPGITNVMCMVSAEKMDSVDSVRIYAGVKETRPSNGLVFPFSVSTVIDEYSRSPVEYINGEYVDVPPLSGDQKVQFLDPVGQNVCHYSIHSEPATLPQSIGRGVRNVEFRLGVSDKMLNIFGPLIEAGLMSDQKTVSINGHLISPREFLISFFNSSSASVESLERWVALKTEVTGIREGSEEKMTCDLVCAPGLNGFKNATASLTGIAGSIFGQLLAEGKVNKGVVSPELAVDPQAFTNELKARGIELKLRRSSPNQP